MMKLHGRRAALSGAGLAAFLVFAAAPGAAQAQAPASEKDAESAAGIGQEDEIIVTARRREESLTDVPLSVQAFGARALEERQILDLSDITRVVPGLTAQASPTGNAALNLAIRGQRQGLANIAYDSAVSVYSDEVVQARTQGLNDAFFDLASVQVLKGPQGTLFGRNTTGGAILITTQSPQDSFGGYADVTIGNYDLFRAEGALNLPISEGIALRVAGAHTRRDGYLASPANGRRVDNQRTDSWRASLLIAPAGSDFENRLIVSGFRKKDDGVAYKLLDRNPAVATTAGLAADLAYYRSSPFYVTNAQIEPDGTNIRTLSVSNISTLTLGNVTLKNIFGYREVDSTIDFDLDATSFLLTRSEQWVRQNQFSNEFQLLGQAFGSQLDYVVGAYVFREDGDEIQTVVVLNPASGTNLITDYSVRSETAAIYGQGTFRPSGLPELALTGGLRYTWDGKGIESRSRTFNGVCRLLTADLGGVPRTPCFHSANANFSKLTYNVSVDYKLAPDTLVYFAHRYGYQGGGFTNSATRPADFAPFRPQTVTDFEIGLKSRFDLGGVDLRANVAGFLGKYDDVQRLLRLNFISGGLSFPVNRILNAASSTVKGVEFDGSASFGKWVRVDAAYTFLDTGYDKYVVVNNGIEQDYTGAGFSGAPRHSVNGSIRVQLPLFGDFAKPYLQADGSYQSKSFAEDTTNFDPVAQRINPRSILAGYGTVNLRFILEDIAGQDLTASAWVRNLTKSEYYTAGVDSYLTSGYLTRLLGAPRTFGVSMRYTF